MFVWFGPEGVKSASTEEVSPGIMLDFDSDGRVIGIEVLDVSERMALPKAAPRAAQRRRSRRVANVGVRVATVCFSSGET